MKFTKWELGLLEALYYEGIDDVKSESAYNFACRSARKEAGDHSAAVGVVLERFAAFLDNHGRKLEADHCEAEVRLILCAYAVAGEFYLARAPDGPDVDTKAAVTHV